jgi:ABC-2 type transport system permease protein
VASEHAITSTGAPHKVARVRVPGAGLRSDLRAIRVVWHREIIRFSRDRARMITICIRAMNDCIWLMLAAIITPNAVRAKASSS